MSYAPKAFPGIKYSRHSNLFLEGQILDGFCKLPNGKLVVAPVWPGWCVFPDFTNPKIRSWWSRQYAYLLDVGKVKVLLSYTAMQVMVMKHPDWINSIC